MRILWLLLLWPVMTGATLMWDYDPTKTIPDTVTIEWSSASSGPWTVKATIPGMPSSYSLDTTYGFYRVSDAVGPSNVVQFPAPITPQPSQVDDDSSFANAIAAICRAAKAAGGSSTSFQGRIRKEIPCV